MIETIERNVERYRHLYLLLLSCLLFLYGGLWAAHRSLWYDELFTFYVSRLETPTDLLRALLSKADSLPPVDYLLRQASMKLLGESEFAFRLPSIILFWIGTLCLYLFVKKRTSAIPALIAFCFPLSTYALKFSHEGRPYSLLFAASCVALWAWQRASENPRNPWNLFMLTLSLAVGPYSHYYGVFNYAPVIVGEAIKNIRERKVAPQIVLAICFSIALSATLYPFVANAAGYSENFWTAVSLGVTISIYRELLGNIPIPLVAIIIASTALLYVSELDGKVGRRSANLPMHEIGAAIVLSLVPFLIYIQRDNAC